MSDDEDKPPGKRIKVLGVQVVGEPIISDFMRQRRAEGRLWAEGYTQSELDAAQEKYDLVFPPDLVALFRDRRPVLGWDWRTDEVHIRRMLHWPYESILFDVEKGLWWPDWGERPATAAARGEALEALLRKAPPLIPLFGHRYLPAEPSEAGNPVFSVYQTDITYYGADLDDYFEREFGPKRLPSAEPKKRIRFWSDLVDRNGEFKFPGMDEKVAEIREMLLKRRLPKGSE